MGIGPGAPSTSVHLKLAVLMSWMAAVMGKEAYPVALVGRSSHHRPAFVANALHRLSLSRAASISSRQRLRRVPPMYQGVNNRPAAPTAASAWGSSKGGLHCTGHRPRRCSFGDDARSSSSICSCSGDSSWDEEASTAGVAAGKDSASRAVRLRKKGLDRRRDGGSGNNTDDGHESSAAALELEPLVERVASALQQRCSVRGGDLVVVLVSGGSDSVALLLALQQAAKTFQPALRVEAVHFNHALRGQDSDADEDFVVDMARRLGVPLHVRRWKGADEGGTGGPGAGMQERARQWRRSEARGILTKSIQGGGGGRGFIATAHHKDDQAETVLLKALRGAHITKMQGMAWHADPFVRPLLGARKSDLVDFLHARGQEWREDGSNQVSKYARNRVRLQLIPLLQELAGGARALDTRLEELSRQSLFAREILEREALRWERQHLGAEEWRSRTEGIDQSRTAGSSEYGGTGQAAAIGTYDDTGSGKGAKVKATSVGSRDLGRDEFPLSAFLKADPRSCSKGEDLPEMVREELLYRFVTANIGDTPLPYAQLQLLMRQVDEGGRKWSLSLGGAFCVRRVGDFLRVERSLVGGGGRDLSDHGGHTLGFDEAIAQQEAEDPASTPVAGYNTDATSMPWRLVVDHCAEGGGSGADGRGTEQGMMLYNVAAGAQLHARRKKDGDRFRPTWRDRPAKLKDFLRGQGVPLHRRDQVALICDQDDTVIAVYPSYPGFEFHQDNTGAQPIRIRIEGTPLFCPRPEDRGGAPG